MNESFYFPESEKEEIENEERDRINELEERVYELEDALSILDGVTVDELVSLTGESKDKIEKVFKVLYN